MGRGAQRLHFKGFCDALLNQANVVVTPGNAFGDWGEGYVRIALVQDEGILLKAIDNVKRSGIFKETIVIR